MGYKLKPCPFCGGKPFFSRHMFRNPDFKEMGWKVNIMCAGCGVYTPEEQKVCVRMDDDGSVSYDREVVEHLANLWNRRWDNEKSSVPRG